MKARINIGPLKKDIYIYMCACVTFLEIGIIRKVLISRTLEVVNLSN